MIPYELRFEKSQVNTESCGPIMKRERLAVAMVESLFQSLRNPIGPCLPAMAIDHIISHAVTSEPPHDIHFSDIQKCSFPL